MRLPATGRHRCRRARWRVPPRQASRSGRASPGRRSAGRASRRRAPRASSGRRGRARAPPAGPRSSVAEVDPTPPRPRGRSRVIAGRTKRRKVTIAETGLPGRPKTSAPCPGDSEPGRLAGLQRHPPEDLLDAEGGKRLLDVIVLANRDAAADRRRARQSGIARSRHGSSSGSSLTVSVGHQLRPRAQGERRDRVGVGVPNATRLRRVTGLQQLVAGGQHRQSRAPDAADRRNPDRREHSELRRTDANAAPEHRGSRLDVISGVPHVGSRLDLGLDLDTSVANARVLDPYDRVGSVRDHRAGRDPDRLSSVQRRPCGPTRPGLIGDREGHRPARTRRPACPPPAPRSRPSRSCRSREPGRRSPRRRRESVRAPRATGPAPRPAG